MNKYLLLDRRLLNPQGMENVCLKTTKAAKDTAGGIFFTESEPWEPRIDNGYPNVIYDKRAGLYRCYYTLFLYDKESKGVSRKERAGKDYYPRPDRVTGLAYAESQDGVNWIKPRLNLTMWEGSRENNILFQYAHGTGVMLDELETDESRRYKMVTKVDRPGVGAYMAVSFSLDGIHWQEFIPWPKYNPPADSHNLPFWNPKEKAYNLISRVWKDGIRVTTFSRSTDFINWSEPRETLRGSGFERQVYAMPVFAWENLYLGLASVIHEGDREEDNFDRVDCELAWAASPDKFDWTVPGESLIERGAGSYPDGDADCGCIYASPPIINEQGNLWIYYMGGNGQHTNFRESSLMRASLRKDQFAAYEARNKDLPGVLSTCSLKVFGDRLEILAEPLDADRKCEIQVMLCKSWSLPEMEGFSYEQSKWEETDAGWKRITFSKSLKELMGMDICIKLRFKNARIWALKGDICQENHRLWEGAGEKAEL